MLKAQNTLMLALGIVLFSVNFNLQISSNLQYEAYYTPNNESFVGFFVLLYAVSAFAGALAVWPISAFTTIGRRYTTFIAIGISVLASIIEISGPSYDQHLAGHIIDGFGAGMIYVVAFLWQVEMAEERHRGKRVAYLIIGAMTGSAVGSWVVEGTETKIARFTSPTLTWQVPVGLQFIFLFFAAIATYVTTESWRWLLSKEQPDRARHIFTTLESYIPSSEINSEFDAVQGHVRAVQFFPGLASCIKSRPVSGTRSLQPWRRIFIACLLQIAASLSGLTTINIMLGSLADDFDTNSGPSSHLQHPHTPANAFSDDLTVESNLIAALPTIQLAFSFLPLAFIDSPRFRLLAGRRNLFIVSFLGMAFSFIIPVVLAASDDARGGYIGFSNSKGSRSYQAAYFAFFILYLLFYSLGAALIPWLYMAEVAASPSATTRTATVAITVAVRFATDLMIDWVMLYGLVDLGWKFWAVWLVLDVFWAVLVFLLVLETARKSLEEIDERFVEGVRWFITVRDRRIEGGKRGGDVLAGTGEGFESVEMNDDVRRRSVSPDPRETGHPEVLTTREEVGK